MIEWILLATTIVAAASCGVLRHRLGESERARAEALDSLKSDILGSAVWVRSAQGNWYKARVVAVSWKGAMAVRRWEDMSGHNAHWIGKHEVDRVSFEEMG